MTKPLTGKTALVTGGAKRIGRAIALALAEQGADVAITYLTSQPEAEKTVHALAELDVEALALPCDLRDPLSIQESVTEVFDRFGRLDLLVNNAAIFESQTLQDITVEQWDNIFATNSRAPFLVSQAAYPHLKTARGRIINIGSLGGLHPWPTHA